MTVSILQWMLEQDRVLPDVALADPEIRRVFEVAVGCAPYNPDAEPPQPKVYRSAFYRWARGRYGLVG